MTVRRDIYNLNAPASGAELDLREYMDRILFGTASELPKGQTLIIRRMRKQNGKPVYCSCYQKLEGEGSASCPYCAGEGKLWDEDWITGYITFIGSDGGLGNRIKHMAPSWIKSDVKVAFFRYDADLEYGDKIIEVKLDVEGRVATSYERRKVYKIETLAKRRGDYGRVEYVAAYCSEEPTSSTEDHHV